VINPSDIKILIAEDEPDLRDLLAAKFRVFGFNVETAHSGSAAWDKLLQSDDFQIVVTDLRMPDGTGFDLLNKVKGRNVMFPRVFVISAFSDVPKHQLFDAGAEDFMPKPFDTKILLDVIRKSLLKTEDRWRAPSSKPAKVDLSFELSELSEAIATEEFGAGRGGFLFGTTLIRYC
jgi:DNA-binding response OmpR family regulator